MSARLSRIAVLAGVALFFTLVALGNITDYGSNFAFVQHVLTMDTTFRSPALMWRAIGSPALHHAAYLAIIAWQVLTAVLCWWGALRLWRVRRLEASIVEHAKRTGIAGLTAGFLLYAVGFIAIGGEWFAMWQSDTWNGQDTAAIFLTMVGIALLHLCGAERDDP
ncbi:DUF2165 family protein [Azospirillum halopraeferens]|uniref:DUF2165 family protein n=1 Tax=Azospirillum halopraeferens TaxID=34010 RepID=UPI00042744F9|nr:DUF2165 domain-containing protein [Azospirillum halopraeferens]